MTLEGNEDALQGNGEALKGDGTLFAPKSRQRPAQTHKGRRTDVNVP